MFAIARRSLKDSIVTGVTLNGVMAGRVLSASLGCTSVVPTAERENATPESKGNKHRLSLAVVFSSSPFLHGALLRSESVLTGCCVAE